MPNLKDKIINEAKRIGVSLIPLAIFLSNKHHEIMSKDNDNWNKGPRFTRKNTAYIWLNVLSSVTLPILLTWYFANVANYHNFNYKYWPRIGEQKRVERELGYQNELRQEFQRLDLNKNAVIDSTEFIYRRDRK